MTAFIVTASRAKMPSGVRARYMRVAVIEVEVDADGNPASPKMISERARGVVRIVETWERCHAGRTYSERTAYGQALRAATELANRLRGEAR